MDNENNSTKRIQTDTEKDFQVALKNIYKFHQINPNMYTGFEIFHNGIETYEQLSQHCLMEPSEDDKRSTEFAKTVKSLRTLGIEISNSPPCETELEKISKLIFDEEMKERVVDLQEYDELKMIKSYMPKTREPYLSTSTVKLTTNEDEVTVEIARNQGEGISDTLSDYKSDSESKAVDEENYEYLDYSDPMLKTRNMLTSDEILDLIICENSYPSLFPPPDDCKPVERSLLSAVDFNQRNKDECNVSGQTDSFVLPDDVMDSKSNGIKLQVEELTAGKCFTKSEKAFIENPVMQEGTGNTADFKRKNPETQSPKNPIKIIHYSTESLKNSADIAKDVKSESKNPEKHFPKKPIKITRSIEIEKNSADVPEDVKTESKHLENHSSKKPIKITRSIEKNSAEVPEDVESKSKHHENHSSKKPIKITHYSTEKNSADVPEDVELLSKNLEKHSPIRPIKMTLYSYSTENLKNSKDCAEDVESKSKNPEKRSPKKPTTVTHSLILPESMCKNSTDIEEDVESVRDMMRRTFKQRKPKLITCHTGEIIMKYPAFRFLPVVKDEYNRITTTDPDSDRMTVLENKLFRRLKKIVRVEPGQNYPLRSVLEKYKKLNTSHPGSLKTAAILVLCYTFCASADSLVTFCNNSTEATPNDVLTPKMIVIGCPFVKCKVVVYSDNIPILELDDVFEGVIAIYCLYYIFDISYASRVQKLMEYLDFLCGLEQSAFVVDPFK